MQCLINVYALIKLQIFHIRRIFGTIDISDDYGPFRPVSKNMRSIDLFSSRSHVFCSNSISTTKYTWWSFIFKFIWEQFHRGANVFFLLMALLQQIPNASPTGRYTTLLPLSFILLLTAIKELIEDIARWKQDHAMNSKTCVAFDSCSSKIKWRDIKVGHIISLFPGQEVPADVLVLWTANGTPCQITTANIDGETNIKERRPPPSVLISSKKIPIKLQVRCDLPNKSIYSFSGFMVVNTDDKLTLGPENICLRGCSIAKSSCALVGLVVYTGPETKIALNSGNPVMKRSKLEIVANTQIFYLFCLLFLMSIVGTFVSLTFSQPNFRVSWYIPDDGRSSSTNVVLTFITFFILFNNMPVSLLFNVELTRAIQAYFINNDLKLYDSNSDIRAHARTSNLNEELGRIRYIFTDKTGTLTINKLQFRKVAFLNSFDEVHVLDHTPSDPSLDSEFNLHMLLVIMSSCHTVIKTLEGYSAESPDELALVEGAEAFGYSFLGRSTDTTNDYIEYSHLCAKKKMVCFGVVPFTSTRKRMSMIVGFENGNYYLLCKGADEVLKPLLRNEIHSNLNREILSFSNEGLRVLLCAYRKLTLSEITAVQGDLKNLEIDLVPVGVTGVEDELQPGAKQVIEDLRSANINVWMLTGDKAEMAEQVARSVGLVPDSSSIYKPSAIYLGIKLHENSGLLVQGDEIDELLSSKTFFNNALKFSSVIGCRLTPKQKADVVLALTTASGNEITLAVGDGANDVAMIQAANVGVGICGREGLQATLASDYSLPNFSGLSRLLLVHGAWNYVRISKVIHYCFFKNILLYFVNFIYQFYAGFSGTTPFEKWSLTFYNMIFTFFPVILIGCFDRQTDDTNKLSLQKQYHCYQKGLLFNTRVFWTNILRCLFYSSVITFTCIGIFLQDSIQVSSIHVDGMFCFGSVVMATAIIIANIKVLLFVDIWNSPLLVSVFSGIAIYFTWLTFISFWELSPVLPTIFANGTGLFANLLPSFVYFLTVFLALPGFCIFIEFVFKCDLIPNLFAIYRNMRLCHSKHTDVF